MTTRTILLSFALLPAVALGAVPSAAARPQEPAEVPEPVAGQAAPAGEEAAGEPPPAQQGEEPAPARKREPQPGDVGYQPQPPDGVWLVDEQGRQYFVDVLPKDKLKLRRLGENQVRISWGITLDLVEEDDDFLYYKQYRTEHIEVEPVNRGPSAEELARVEASYAVEVRESDRLTFVPAGEGLPETGQWRNGFELADVNADGHLDIVHGPPRKALAAPIVFLGDGKGGWKPWAEARFTPLAYDYGDVAVGDFNADGHADIAVASHLRGLLALTGDGAGKFEAWTEGLGFSVTAPVFSSRAITAADWNGDGREDLLAVGEGPSLRPRGGPAPGPAGKNRDFRSGSFGPVVYLSGEDGHWELQHQGNSRHNTFGDDITTGDFNADGRLDFAIGSNTLGRKNILHLGLDGGSWEERDLEALRPGAYVRALRAADFDGDGRDDLAVAYLSFEQAVWRTGIDVLLSRPEGRWQRMPVFAHQTHEGIYALAVGDLDGDGRLDLVGLTGVGEIRVFLGEGDGRFLAEKTPEVPAEPGRCRGYHVEIADVDGDGQGEVVAGFAGEPSPIFDPDHCRHLGSLRAWDVRVGEEETQAARPAPPGR